MARHRQLTIAAVCFGALVVGSLRWNFNSPFTKFATSPIISFNAKDRYDITNINATTTMEQHQQQLTLPIRQRDMMDSNNQSSTSTSSTQHDVNESTALNDSADSSSSLSSSSSSSSSPSSSSYTITNYSSCFALNSQSWLHGSRIGNIQVPPEWIDHMMHPSGLLRPPTIHTLFGQTLCYETGRFRANTSFTADNDRRYHYSWNESDPQQVYDWEFRLIYLALHRQFHLPAFEEYQQRRDCGLVLEQQQQKQPLVVANLSKDDETPSSSPSPLIIGHLGNFDYECPNAKYLVTVLNSRSGMGAVMKNSIMPSIYIALATGRIPLFLQAVRARKGVPRMVTQPLLLTSCERRDWQCIYLPISPCVLTVEDIRQHAGAGAAAVLSPEESRDLKQLGRLSDTLNQTKVLISGDFTAVPIHERFAIHHTIRAKIHEAVLEMLHDWRNNSRSTDDISAEQWSVLTAAAEKIGTPYTTHDNRKWRYLRAALIYAMRPNPKAQHEIQLQVQAAILPNHTSSSDTYHGNRQYFGLPVRGSDKCRFESTCLTFDSYMQLMMSKWQQHGTSGKRGTIILTSEDADVLPRRMAYMQNMSFPFDFVVNDRDVQPGTGKSTRYYDRADAIMISSLVVFKLQLLSNVLVGNCCSNFHKLLFELVGEGCGADPRIESQCLNDIEDPQFRICCGWTKDGACKQIWADHQARRSAAFAAANAAAATAAVVVQEPSLLLPNTTSNQDLNASSSEITTVIGS